MSELTFKQKVDVILFLVLLFLCITLLFFIRANSEIREIDLSLSQLKCKQYDERYTGYFVLNGEEFYITGHYYNSCDGFRQFAGGTKIYAKYLSKNNAIIRLIVDDEFKIEDTKTKMVYMGIFFTIFVFCFVRKPIQKIADKYV